MRRLRSGSLLRDLLSESSIKKEKMIMPVFIDENLKTRKPIESMPGIFRYGTEDYLKYIQGLADKGVRSILLFGIPSGKDAAGSSSYDRNGIVQTAIRGIKDSTGITVIADLCLCEYTDTGQCGIMQGQLVDNDSTLTTYRKIAHTYADAGVDIIAPSGMMDGQVGAIRDELEKSGYSNTLIMGYSAKYASNLYGPFREAADSAPRIGDRKSYQMDYRNSREALRELELDLEEGADMLMVKPALFYLDVLREARVNFSLPLAAYSVSGEYTMIRNAVEQGFLGKDAITESITSIFRAGADLLISYFTEYVCSGNLDE